jgi:phosphoenolpyruvate phosphomutase
MTSSEDLRKLLCRDGIATAVGARDALTAKIVEQNGFDALWLSSFELSASRGLPDLGLLTMSDCLEVAQQIRSASRLPLLVDCDTGFGGTRNFVWTIEQFSGVGIAGVCIEDKTFPKRNSFLPGEQELEDAGDFARRIATAKAEDAGNSIVLVARTEALIAGRGVAEALDRANRYADSGADAILVHSKRPDASEIIAFMERWRQPTPVVIVPTTYGGWPLQAAADAGISLVIYANHALRASIQATIEVLSEISGLGETESMTHQMASMASIFELTDVARWERMDKS